MRLTASHKHTLSAALLLLCSLFIGVTETHAQNEKYYYWQMVDKPGDNNFLYIKDNQLLWGTKEEASSNMWKMVDYSRFVTKYSGQWHANNWDGVFLLVSANTNQIVRRTNTEEWGIWNITNPHDNDDDIVNDPAGMMKLSGSYNGYDTYVYAFPSWNATFPCNPTDDLSSDNGTHYTHVRFISTKPAYWDDEDTYYIEFEDYDPESSEYDGKYLCFNPGTWTIQRGKSNVAVEWKITPTENGYVLTNEFVGRPLYFSWTEDNESYCLVDNDDVRAIEFTGIEVVRHGSDVKYALWVDTSNGRRYLNGNNLSDTKSYFHLVKEVNDDVIDYGKPTSEKTIKHRVHQSVIDAKQYIQEYPKAVGFLDGSKEWIDNGYGKQMQYCSTYETTQYVDPNGGWTTCYLPMIQYGSLLLHRAYQRFYNYRTDSLYDSSITNFGGAASRMVTYQNGYVTGIAISGHNDDGYSADNAVNYVNRSVNVKLPAGMDSFDLACDLSDNIFEDLEKDATGDVAKEPSLTQRVIWHLRSGKEMADKLQALEADEWLEDKTIHFPAKSVNFEPDVLGLDYEFANYWFYKNGNITSIGTNNNDITVSLSDYGTGISLLNGQKDSKSTIQGDGKGIYQNPNLGYPGSRFIAFVYPNGGSVSSTANPAVIEVRFGGYRVARFTIYFDDNSQTLPWDEVLQENSQRSPNGLKRKTGHDAIASITFDYPNQDGFEVVNEGVQNERYAEHLTRRRFKASVWPLDFDNANYIHYFKQIDTHRHASNGYYYDTKFGEYMLTSETSFWNALGPFLGVNNYNGTTDLDGTTYNPKNVPASEQWNPATGFQPGFLYVDASERAGQVAQIPFSGTFCAGNKMMCSGWMTSGAAYGWAGQSPASVVLTVIGRDYDESGRVIREEVLHRFCPGNLSLDVRYSDGRTMMDADPEGNDWVASKYKWDNNNETGPWQQFYFEFSIEEQFDQYMLNIDNNCVNTNGGDYMLDDIMIFASVPTVEVDRSTPLCIMTDENGEAKYDAKLLKMEVPFDNELELEGVDEATAEVPTDKLRYKSFAIIEKDKFLTAFQQQLSGMNITKTKKEIEEGLATGEFEDPIYNNAYAVAFKAAQIGKEEDKEKYWQRGATNNPTNVGICEFAWSPYFESELQPLYNFTDASTNPQPLYRRIVNNDGTEIRYLVFNANVSGIEWKTYTEYYVISSQTKITSASDFAEIFNMRSACTKMYSFELRPPVELKGIELDGNENAVACENQIPTLLAKMEAYTADEEKKSLDKIYFDWFYGKLPTTENPDGVKADIAHFNANVTGYDFSPRKALMYFRINYPDAETLDGIIPASKEDAGTVYELTADMITVLRQLVAEGQLELHSRAVNVHAQKWSDDDPYTYIVAIPIHDANYNLAIYGTTENPSGVVYYCDEPQPLRISIQNIAPKLDAGFEDGMNGIDVYNYPENTGILSVRLARMGQYQNVQHGDRHSLSADGSKLWIPVKGAVGSSGEVIGVKHNISLQDNDPYLYLTKTNDPEYKDVIADAIDGVEGKYPVGTIYDLIAVDATNDTSRDPDKVNHLGVYFWEDFKVRDGYYYTLKVPFLDDMGDGSDPSNACEGHMLINLKIVPDYEVWVGTDDNHDWNNDKNWRRADADDLLLKENGYAPNTDQEYLTNEGNGNHNGFAPLYCTHLLIMTPDGTTNRGSYSPELYDIFGNGRTLSDGSKVSDVSSLDNSPFPNLNPETATDILKYDFQASPYQTHHEEQYSSVAKDGDYIAEMYEINVCKDIVFQSQTELLNAHLLSYDKAWVEFALGKNKWHIVGSPLKDMVAGEWYAPTLSARQETTYFEPVYFGDEITDGGWNLTDNSRYDIAYDRFSPAVYQRCWDKAKAVVYEKGANWRTTDGSQTDKLGDSDAGVWSDNRQEWENNADEYLDRISYKPMGYGKANVAIKGTWSGTYNDAAVRYSEGGFSVLPINTHKDKDRNPDELTIFRLPKEDAWYDTYDFGTSEGKRDKNTGSRVYIEDNFNKNFTELQRPVTYPNEGFAEEKSADNTIQLENRGILRSNDLAGRGTEGVAKDKILMDESKEYTMTLKNEGKGSTGLFLACNPFICGLDMQKFFEVNTNVAPFYLVLNDNMIQGDPELTSEHAKDWSWKEVDVMGAFANDVEGEQVVEPRYAFFLRAKKDGDLDSLTVKFTADMMARAYPKAETGNGSTPAKPYMTIRAQRGNTSSEAKVWLGEEYSNKFLAEEDMETFIDEQLADDVPVVYTLTGRLATSMNRLHDFTCLPLGVESNSDETCVLTFTGVDNLAALQLYDAYLESLTPVEEGMVVRVPGQTQNRYFLVCGTPSVGVAESNIQIYGESGMVHVVSTTTTPLTAVRAYDAAGRLVYADAPDKADYLFSLPKGVFIIEATTEKDRKVQKHSIY